MAEAASEVLPAGAGLAKDFEDAPPRLTPPKPTVPPNEGAALAVLPLGAALAPTPPVPPNAGAALAVLPNAAGAGHPPALAPKDVPLPKLRVDPVLP